MTRFHAMYQKIMKISDFVIECMQKKITEKYSSKSQSYENQQNISCQFWLHCRNAGSVSYSFICTSWII